MLYMCYNVRGYTVHVLQYGGYAVHVLQYGGYTVHVL